MTSIGTEKISRGDATRVPYFSLLRVFTGITRMRPRPHSSDGYSIFSSLSPYRPSFNNRSRHSVGLDSFGAVAWPCCLGSTIISAEPWTPTPLLIVAMVGFFVLISLWLFRLYRNIEKDAAKDRERREYLKKGGEPRDWNDVRAGI